MRQLVAKYGTAFSGLLILVFMLVFANNFASAANILAVLKQTSFMAVLALGLTLALITSELDLSFANLCSLAAVVTGGLIYDGTNWVLAVLVGLVIGAVGGLINGLLVTVAKVPSLIATIGTSSIANGLAFMITGGVAFVGRWDPTFLSIARGRLLGIPLLVYLMFVCVALGLLLTKSMKLGVHMLATGEATDAAHRAGIATARMKVVGLTLSGLAAGVTAVLLVADLSSAVPGMAGGYLLQGIAAVLLGMTMFDPGRPNVLGTFTGSLIISILANGLVLLGSPYYMQDIILGLIVVGSVSVSASVLKRAAFSV